MAPPYQNNVAQVTILATEIATSNVLVNRSFAPALAALEGIFGTYLNPPGTTVALPFPAGLTTIFNFYVRNLAGVGGNAMSFNFVTTSGGTPMEVTLLSGDLFLYWSNVGSAVGGVAGYGITSVNLLAPAGGGTPAPFEYFMGG